MRVVVEQDEGSKLVGLAWVIDAGLDDDPPARPGLAHVVEHLLWVSPDATGVSTWRRLTELGATTNAQTELDLTTAYAFAPRAALDELVEIFLDRVADPARGVDQAVLAKELRVVGEELALRGNGMVQPGVRVSVEALSGRPMIADPAAMRAALETITVDDVRSFMAAHYRPERMTIVLSGPVASDWERRFVAGLPAGLAGAAEHRRAPERHALAAAPGAAPRPEIVTVDAPVGERELWLAWPIAAARGKDAVPMRLVAALAGRLLERRIGSSAITDVSRGSANVVSSPAFGAFLFRLVLRPGADPAHARQEAADVLETLRALPVADWLRAERSRAELDLQGARLELAFSMASLEARTLSRARLAHDAPEQGVADIVDAAIDSSIGNVADVVGRELPGPPARSILLASLPGGRLDARRAPAPPAERGDASPSGHEEVRDDGEPERAHDAGAIVATAQGLGARDARTSRLANGLTLIVLPRRGLPVASMLLGFHADPAPGESPGLRTAFALARSFWLKRSPLERAILQRSFVEPDAAVETLELFASSAKSALDLLWDEAPNLRTKWPSPLGEAWMRSAAVREATVDAHISRAFSAALWGAHPYAPDDHSTVVRAVTADDLQRWTSRVRRPANGVLVVVGDVDAAAVAAEADDVLSDWSADAAPAAAPVAPPAAAAARQAPVLAGREEGRAWTKLKLGCFLPPAKTARDGVVGELLADALEDELFRRLRVERGASYAPHLRSNIWRGGTHVLTGTLDVEPGAAPAARDLVRSWLDPAGTTALDAAAIEEARWRAARRSGLRDATNDAIAHRLFEAWNRGWPLESLDDYPRDLASITAADVAAALAACRASAVISVVAPP
jgi:predicted Zn-dependent peptidase